MLGPPPSGQRSTCSVHHQYSSSVSPFQAKTGTPAGASAVPSGPTTTAAAAWSWVEKMLQRAPAHLGAERGEGLDEHGGLDGHVQRAGDAGPGQRLGVGVLGAQGHEAGHLVLGELDLLAAEVGQGEVGDLEVVEGRRVMLVPWILRIVGAPTRRERLRIRAGVTDTFGTARGRRLGDRPSSWRRSPDPPVGRASTGDRRRRRAEAVEPGAGARPGEGRLEVVEDRDRTRVDALAGGQLERHEVADEDQVEQLGQLAVALGRGPRCTSATTSSQDLVDELEAAGHLGVLDVVAQVDER